jgi:Na+-driven multidrug efflux pump
LAGWFVFELQVMIIANIHGIPQAAMAAGAIWVQIETSLAAAQDGWLRTTSMRTLQLLGKNDPGARRAFELFNWLAAASVAISNVFIVVFRKELSQVISNDAEVQQWLADIVWVLAAHTQTRISCLNPLFLFIPLGKGMLRTVITFVSFYLVALPIVFLVALTDLATTQVPSKLVACVGYSSIAQAVMFIWMFWYLRRLDWQDAAMIINRRANNDRREVDIDSKANAASMEMESSEAGRTLMEEDGLAGA